MSDPMPPRVRLSFARSRTRRRVLLALASLREGYLGQLAEVAGASRRRTRAVLLGQMPDFAPSLSLVELGLALVEWDGRGMVYRVTPRGLREARRLTSRWRRLSRKAMAME